MADARTANLDHPDEVVSFPRLRAELVEVGDVTIARITLEPGWRWSTHMRPKVGGQSCQARHLGLVLKGQLAIQHSDGRQREYRPNDVFDISPGHDGWTIGDEACTVIEWTGMKAFAGFPTGLRSRVLVTLLMTDLVNSTELVRSLGDGRWRQLLSRHFEAVRVQLERFGGREIKTTGDGVLATFDSTARGLHCANAIRLAARADGLLMRLGVHLGEVEVVGDDVRGVTVHETARIMDAAGNDEILVSSLARALAEPAGFTFEDRGLRTFKGLEGTWRLAALVVPEEAARSSEP